MWFVHEWKWNKNGKKNWRWEVWRNFKFLVEKNVLLLKKSIGNTTYKKKVYIKCKWNLQFFWGLASYKKDNVHEKKIVENLGLLIVKNHLPIKFVDSIWLKGLVMQLYLYVVFFPRKTYSQ
jgi:hypothetical protein